MTYGVTKHAVKRYQERVRPTLEPAAAKAELLRLLEMAPPPTDEAPDWHRKLEPGDVYVLLSDGIAAVLKGTDVTTVLVRGSHSDFHRERKKERKRKKKSEKRWRNDLTRPRQRRTKEQEWA